MEKYEKTNIVMIDNNNYPLVSVVVPTYNRTEVLPRALKSVLYQTYENVECIVVDAGSTDETFSYISKTFQQEIKSQRVKIFRNERVMNISETRNVGISHCSGEYIAFLDDDDIWLPDKIEKQLNEIAHTGARVCFCAFMWVEDNNVLKTTILKDKRSSFQHGGPPSTWLIHRSVFDEIGFFDSNFSANEDTEFLVRLNKNTKSCFADELLYIHYYYDSQLSSSNETKIIGWEKMLNKHKLAFNSYEKRSAYFRLAVFYLLGGKKRFNFILKSLRYRPDLQNIIMFLIMLLPSTQLSKFLLNKVLDHLRYPKSLVGRYKK